MSDAVAQLQTLLANPAKARALAKDGQAAILRSHSNRAVGLRMLDRIEAALQLA